MATLRTVLSRAGDAILNRVSRLLAQDRVFHNIQRALLSTLDARRKLERNVGRLLAMASLPSQQELEHLQEQIKTIEAEIVELTERVNTLTGQLERPKREAFRREDD